MAVNVFLDITGAPGESQDNTRADTIDVLSWSWGMTQSGTTHLGPGAGSGKVAVADISFTKYVDKATPVLMKHCASGKHLENATLYVYKAAGDSPLEYFKLEMETVLVSSYQTGGGGDGLDRIVESVSLNFRTFKVTYTQQDATGAAAGSVPIGWDIAKNAEVSAG